MANKDGRTRIAAWARKLSPPTTSQIGGDNDMTDNGREVSVPADYPQADFWLAFDRRT